MSDWNLPEPEPEDRMCRSAQQEHSCVSRPLCGEALGDSEFRALCRPPPGSRQGGRHSPAQSVHSASCILPPRSGFLSASRPAGVVEPRQAWADGSQPPRPLAWPARPAPPLDWQVSSPVLHLLHRRPPREPPPPPLEPVALLPFLPLAGVQSPGLLGKVCGLLL